MSRASHRAGLLKRIMPALACCVACGGGRSGLWQGEGAAGTPIPVASVSGGGGIQLGGRGPTTTTGSGGRVLRVTGGTTSVGGRATGGRAIGGTTSIGGRATGGNSSTAGSVPRGYISSGGIASGGIAGTAMGGISIAGSQAGGTAGTSGRDATGGFSGSLAGNGGLGGAGVCSVSRAGATAVAGMAGAPTSMDWYVDALHGNDQGPGTLVLPLRSLGCASTVAGPGDTVHLLDGTWDPNLDAKFGSNAVTACGMESGVAFASNVTLRAVHAGSAKIASFGNHGICMSGGAIENVRFDCMGSNHPVVETEIGSLEIRGMSLVNCGTYGIDISGNAQVTLRPNVLFNYGESSVDDFARVRGSGSFTVEGGTISFQGTAIELMDSAQLILRGASLAPFSLLFPAASGVWMSGGSPRLLVEGGTRFEKVRLGISSYGLNSAITIDGMTVLNGSMAIDLAVDPLSVPLEVTVNDLSVSDSDSTGINLSGPFHVSVANSKFNGCRSNPVNLYGSGTATFDGVVSNGADGSLRFETDDAGSPIAVKMRNVQVTGGQAIGVTLLGYVGDTFDLGTASSPGNNVFRGNGLMDPGTSANLYFDVAAGVVVQAVGNTWDANQQGADANGQYLVGPSGAALDVTTGDGPNYMSGATSAGTLRLAENPPGGG